MSLSQDQLKEYTVLVSIIETTHKKFAAVSDVLKHIQANYINKPQSEVDQPVATLLKDTELHAKVQHIYTLCNQLVELIQKEQNLDRHYGHALRSEFKMLEQFDIKALRSIQIMRQKASTCGSEINELIAKIPVYKQLQGDESRIIQEVMTIFHLLAELRSKNVSELAIFKKDLKITMGASEFLTEHTAIANLLVEEASILAKICDMHLHISKATLNEENKIVSIKGQLTDFKNRLPASFKRLVPHRAQDLIPIQHDRATMEANQEEWPMLEHASRLGLGIIKESHDTALLLSQIGERYVLILADSNAKVLSDTIAIAYRELARVIEYVKRRWREDFDRLFPEFNFVPLIISGVSRTYEYQGILHLTNAFAAPANRSAHVSWLAVDFALNGLRDDLIKNIRVGQNRSEVSASKKEELKERIIKFFNTILAPLLNTKVRCIATDSAGKVHNHILAVLIRIIESNGCYHISLNPDPKSIAVLDRMQI